MSGKVYVGIFQRAKQTHPLVRSPFESKGESVIEWSIHYFFEGRLFDSGCLEVHVDQTHAKRRRA